MSDLVVINHLTLDGVMQGPAGPDEDRRDGFELGGWAIAGNDAVMGKVMGEGMAQGGSLLLGRWTYESMYSFWPNQKDNPFTAVLDNTEKYVASNSLKEPLPWKNSTLLDGDATTAVEDLKKRDKNDVGVLGSGDLVQSLMRHGLVDRFVLMIHPVVLGTGRRLFPDGTPPANLRLTDSVVTTTGVVIATYQAT
jgi:dihydrofolate reductase